MSKFSSFNVIQMITWSCFQLQVLTIIMIVLFFQVENQRARDAERGHEIAKLLEGHVERKVCNKEVIKGNQIFVAILMVTHGE